MGEEEKSNEKSVRFRDTIFDTVVKTVNREGVIDTKGDRNSVPPSPKADASKVAHHIAQGVGAHDISHGSTVAVSSVSHNELSIPSRSMASNAVGEHSGPFALLRTDASALERKQHLRRELHLAENVDISGTIPNKSNRKPTLASRSDSHGNRKGGGKSEPTTMFPDIATEFRFDGLTEEEMSTTAARALDEKIIASQTRTALNRSKDKMKSMVDVAMGGPISAGREPTSSALAADQSRTSHMQAQARRYGPGQIDRMATTPEITHDQFVNNNSDGYRHGQQQSDMHSRTRAGMRSKSLHPGTAVVDPQSFRSTTGRILPRLTMGQLLQEIDLAIGEDQAQRDETSKSKSTNEKGKGKGKSRSGKSSARPATGSGGQRTAPLSSPRGRGSPPISPRTTEGTPASKSGDRNQQQQHKQQPTKPDKPKDPAARARAVRAWKTFGASYAVDRQAAVTDEGLTSNDAAQKPASIILKRRRTASISRERHRRERRAQRKASAAEGGSVNATKKKKGKKTSKNTNKNDWGSQRFDDDRERSSSPSRQHSAVFGDDDDYDYDDDDDDDDDYDDDDNYDALDSNGLDGANGSYDDGESGEPDFDREGTAGISGGSKSRVRINKGEQFESLFPKLTVTSAADAITAALGDENSDVQPESSPDGVNPASEPGATNPDGTPAVSKPVKYLYKSLEEKRAAIARRKTIVADVQRGMSQGGLRGLSVLAVGRSGIEPPAIDVVGAKTDQKVNIKHSTASAIAAMMGESEIEKKRRMKKEMRVQRSLERGRKRRAARLAAAKEAEMGGKGTGEDPTDAYKVGHHASQGGQPKPVHISPAAQHEALLRFSDKNIRSCPEATFDFIDTKCAEARDRNAEREQESNWDGTVKSNVRRKWEQLEADAAGIQTSTSSLSIRSKSSTASHHSHHRHHSHHSHHRSTEVSGESDMSGSRRRQKSKSSLNDPQDQHHPHHHHHHHHHRHGPWRRSKSRKPGERLDGSEISGRPVSKQSQRRADKQSPGEPPSAITLVFDNDNAKARQRPVNRPAPKATIAQQQQQQQQQQQVIQKNDDDDKNKNKNKNKNADNGNNDNDSDKNENKDKGSENENDTKIDDHDDPLAALSKLTSSDRRDNKGDSRKGGLLGKIFDSPVDIAGEELVKLQAPFASMATGEEGIDIDGFVELFSQVVRTNERDLRLLFRKFDTDTDGTLTWAEFTQHLLKEKEESVAEKYKPRGLIQLPKMPWAAHRHMIDKLTYIPSRGVYMSAGRDCHVNVWAADDFSLTEQFVFEDFGPPESVFKQERHAGVNGWHDYGSGLPWGRRIKRGLGSMSVEEMEAQERRDDKRKNRTAEEEHFGADELRTAREAAAAAAAAAAASGIFGAEDARKFSGAGNRSASERFILEVKAREVKRQHEANMRMQRKLHMQLQRSTEQHPKPAVDLERRPVPIAPRLCVTPAPYYMPWVTDLKHNPYTDELVLAAVDRTVSTFVYEKGSYRRRHTFLARAVPMALDLTAAHGDPEYASFKDDTVDEESAKESAARGIRVKVPASSLSSSSISAGGGGGSTAALNAGGGGNRISNMIGFVVGDVTGTVTGHAMPKDGFSVVQYHRNHAAAVTTARLHSCGLVSSDVTGGLLLCDAARWDLVTRFKGHPRAITSVDFSQSRSILASAGLDRTISVWNPHLDEPIVRLYGHTGPIVSVTFNDDDHQIFSVGMDKTVRVWDVRTFRCIQTLKDDYVHSPDDEATCALFVSDRKRLVTAGSAFRCYDVDLGQGRHGSAAAAAAAVAAAASASNSTLSTGVARSEAASSGISTPSTPLAAGGAAGPAAASPGGPPVLRRTHTGGVVRSARAKKAAANALAVSHSAAAAVAQAKKDAAGGGSQSTSSSSSSSTNLPGPHSSPKNNKRAPRPTAVADTPSSMMLLAKVDAKNSAEELERRRRDEEVARATSNSDSVSMTIPVTAKGFGSGPIAPRAFVPREGEGVVEVLYSTQFTALVVVRERGRVDVCDVRKGVRDFTFRAKHKSVITAACLDWHGKRLVTGSHDGTVRLWNFNNGLLLHEFERRASEITGLYFLPPNQSDHVLVGTDWEGNLILWPSAEASENGLGITLRRGHRDDVLSLAAKGSYVSTGGADGRLVLWIAEQSKVKTASIVPTPRGVTIGVTAIVHLPKRDARIVGTDDGFVHIFSYGDAKLIAQAAEQMDDAVSAMAVDSTERFLAVGSKSGKVAFFVIPNSVNGGGSSDDPRGEGGESDGAGGKANGRDGSAIHHAGSPLASKRKPGSSPLARDARGGGGNKARSRSKSTSKPSAKSSMLAAATAGKKNGVEKVSDATTDGNDTDNDNTKKKKKKKNRRDSVAERYRRRLASVSSRSSMVSLLSDADGSSGATGMGGPSSSQGQFPDEPAPINAEIARSFHLATMWSTRSLYGGPHGSGGKVPQGGISAILAIDDPAVFVTADSLGRVFIHTHRGKVLAECDTTATTHPTFGWPSELPKGVRVESQASDSAAVTEMMMREIRKGKDGARKDSAGSEGEAEAKAALVAGANGSEDADEWDLPTIDVLSMQLSKITHDFVSRRPELIPDSGKHVVGAIYRT